MCRPDHALPTPRRALTHTVQLRDAAAPGATATDGAPLGPSRRWVSGEAGRQGGPSAPEVPRRSDGADTRDRARQVLIT